MSCNHIIGKYNTHRGHQECCFVVRALPVRRGTHYIPNVKLLGTWSYVAPSDSPVPLRGRPPCCISVVTCRRLGSWGPFPIWVARAISGLVSIVDTGVRSPLLGGNSDVDGVCVRSMPLIWATSPCPRSVSIVNALGRSREAELALDSEA